MWNKEALSGVSESRPRGIDRGQTNVAAEVRHARVAQPEPGATAATLLDPKTLEKTLNNLSAHVQNLQRSLHFSVDKESGDTIVRVIDAETKEVIRQIPSEELLAISNRLRSTAGVLLTEHV